LGQNQGIGLSGGQVKFAAVLADTGAGCVEIGIKATIPMMQRRTARPAVLFVDMNTLSVHSFPRDWSAFSRASEITSARRNHLHSDTGTTSRKKQPSPYLSSQKGILFIRFMIGVPLSGGNEVARRRPLVRIEIIFGLVILSAARRSAATKGKSKDPEDESPVHASCREFSPCILHVSSFYTRKDRFFTRNYFGLVILSAARRSAATRGKSKDPEDTSPVHASFREFSPCILHVSYVHSSKDRFFTRNYFGLVILSAAAQERSDKGQVEGPRGSVLRDAASGSSL
jgi:hypothetical protein